jgi:hypothetical protein
MEHASCHPSDAYSFEVAPTFLENSWTPVLNNWQKKESLKGTDKFVERQELTDSCFTG